MAGGGPDRRAERLRRLDDQHASKKRKAGSRHAGAALDGGGIERSAARARGSSDGGTTASSRAGRAAIASLVDAILATHPKAEPSGRGVRDAFEHKVERKTVSLGAGSGAGFDGGIGGTTVAAARRAQQRHRLSNVPAAARGRRRYRGDQSAEGSPRAAAAWANATHADCAPLRALWREYAAQHLLASAPASSDARPAAIAASLPSLELIGASVAITRRAGPEGREGSEPLANQSDQVNQRTPPLRGTVVAVSRSAMTVVPRGDGRPSTPSGPRVVPLAGSSVRVALPLTAEEAGDGQALVACIDGSRAVLSKPPSLAF